jgi:hypothetical protein
MVSLLPPMLDRCVTKNCSKVIPFAVGVQQDAPFVISPEERRIRSQYSSHDWRGQEILVVPKKQPIFAQGDEADAVFYVEAK